MAKVLIKHIISAGGEGVERGQEERVGLQELGLDEVEGLQGVGAAVRGVAGEERGVGSRRRQELVEDGEVERARRGLGPRGPRRRQGEKNKEEDDDDHGFHWRSRYHHLHLVFSPLIFHQGGILGVLIWVI